MDERGTRPDMPMKPQVVTYNLNKLLNDDAIVSADSGTIAQSARSDTEAGIMPTETRFIPLLKAIKELQASGLATELNGNLLGDICRQINADPSGDNEAIEWILQRYYCDGTDAGARRSEQDRYFYCDYQEFPVGPCFQYLSSLLGRPGFLRFTGKQQQFEPWMVVNYVRFDGKENLRPCNSIVGVIEAFNEELRECQATSFFHSLDTREAFSAFAMTDELKDHLANLKVLHFD